MRIPQCDPRAGLLRARAEIEMAISSVLESGEYVLGASVRSFEAAFADYIGVRYAVGVASGTDAIHLALRALGIGEGAEVIVPSHTAAGTVVGIEMAGAVPVFADIDEERFTLDPASVGRAITSRTKAILPVHLYGQPAAMDELLCLSEQYRIPIVEDCAQSTGAGYRGRKTGSWGAAGCFSFYPTKNLGALGDGGMVTTADQGVYEKLCSLRQYGWCPRYVSASRGYNSRLDELQASVLLVKLAGLEEANRRRALIAEHYGARLTGTAVRIPRRFPEGIHAFHQYVVRHSRRDALRAWLAQNGIGTGIHYPVPLHQQPAYLAKARAPGGLPITERLVSEILSLPLYPELSIADADSVCDSILAFESSRS
jgi:dTDP-4-amino-4,6-dideoxygalactose transaminase